MKKKFIKDAVFYVIVAIVTTVLSVLLLFISPWKVNVPVVVFLPVTAGSIFVAIGIVTLLIGAKKKSGDIKQRGTALLASGAIVVLFFVLR